MCPEEIIFLIRMFPCFRGIHRDPAVGLYIELRPAVIARYSPSMLIRRQGKTDFETGRNSGGPHHPNEQRVEIRAVAALGSASPYRVAVSPTGAGFVVAHGCDDVVVDRACFREWLLDS